MLWLIPKFLLTLLAELIGVACTAGVMYAYWNILSKKKIH